MVPITAGVGVRYKNAPGGTEWICNGSISVGRRNSAVACMYMGREPRGMTRVFISAKPSALLQPLHAYLIYK